MNRTILTLLGGIAAMAMPAVAEAGGRTHWDVSVGVGIGGDRSWGRTSVHVSNGSRHGWSHRYYEPRFRHAPVFRPPPAYVCPSVVYAPPPVVYAPPPVVYAPAPVVCAPPVVYRPMPAYGYPPVYCPPAPPPVVYAPPPPYASYRVSVYYSR
jgi:hypothetical protein